MNSKVWDNGEWREPTEEEKELIGLSLLMIAAAPLLATLGILAAFVGYICDRS